jgi:hypothetical protein
MNLPFKYGKVIEDEFFVNREKEIGHIKKLVLSKINLTLISPRRWGKSSLIHKVGRELSDKKTVFCYIDLFNIRNEEGFYQYFATQVIKSSYSKWEERIESTKVFFKNLVPKFSFGIDPNEQFSVSFDWESVQKEPNEILNLPEVISKQKNIHLVICLDEFQNITFFDDPLGFQKKARSVWQHHQDCSYILYGSKRNMMSGIFENKSMPFYKFGEIMLLSKIKNEHWAKYIQTKFRNTKKKISRENASKIAAIVDNHPYFVQQLANAVWITTKNECTKKNIQQGLDNLLAQHEPFFDKEIDSLSNLQLNLLKAIAMDEKSLNSAETIKKYNLNSSSSASRSKEALSQKEIIDTFGNEIEFLDPLLKIWIREVYM